MTHICISKQTIIGSYNGLSPGRRQAIIWTNAGILLIGPLGTKFNEILIEIHTFSFKEMHLKIPSGKWRPFCLGLKCVKNNFPANCFVSKLHLSQDDYTFQAAFLNALRSRQNGRHFTDDILKCILLNENVWTSIKIPLKFVPRGAINNIPALV